MRFGQHQLLLPGLWLMPVQGNGFGQAVELHGHHQRLIGIEVGQTLWPDFRLDARLQFQTEAGQHRCFQLLEQPVDRLGHPIAVMHRGEVPAADLGGLAQQVAVGRGADADGEQPGLLQPVLDHVQYLLLVADRTVGNEHQLAQVTRFAGL